MKPNSKQPRSLFEQARSQFGRAVVDALATSLEALGERLGAEKPPLFTDPGNVADQPRHRLRRMLQNDRGLGPRVRAPESDAREDENARESERERESESESESESETVRVREGEIETARAREIEIETAHVSAPPDEAELIAPLQAASAQEPEPEPLPDLPAVDHQAGSPVICDEPIRTRSMARLLASQGHHQRALSIYDALLAAGASDPLLEAEATALRDLPTS
jgi:hypothetical protein